MPVARRRGRPSATAERRPEPNHTRCWGCGGSLWVAYHSRRRVTLQDEVVQLTVVVRCCRTPTCARYRRPYRPEEGALALPHGEVGRGQSIAETSAVPRVGGPLRSDPTDVDGLLNAARGNERHQTLEVNITNSGADARLVQGCRQRRQSQVRTARIGAWRAQQRDVRSRLSE
jgi:hypothetical protein